MLGLECFSIVGRNSRKGVKDNMRTDHRTLHDVLFCLLGDHFGYLEGFTPYKSR